jgi:hypothetical protein
MNYKSVFVNFKLFLLCILPEGLPLRTQFYHVLHIMRGHQNVKKPDGFQRYSQKLPTTAFKTNFGRRT